MENINCKKFLLGAVLVAFGSTQAVVNNFPQYSQGPTNAYVDLSLPESVTLGGQALVGSQLPVQQNVAYQGGRAYQQMPSNIGGNGVTVLGTRSEIVTSDGASYGSQLSQAVNGYGYATSNEYRNLDPTASQQARIYPDNYQLGLQAGSQVQQPVAISNQQAPVVDQYGRPEIYGQQLAQQYVPEQAQQYVYQGAANINTGDQLVAAQARSQLRGRE